MLNVKGLFSGSLAVTVPTVAPTALLLTIEKVALLTVGGLFKLITALPVPVALPSLAAMVRLKLVFVPKSPGSVTVITPALLMAKGRVPSLSVSVLPLV